MACETALSMANPQMVFAFVLIDLRIPSEKTEMPLVVGNELKGKQDKMLTEYHHVKKVVDQ